MLKNIDAVALAGSLLLFLRWFRKCWWCCSTRPLLDSPCVVAPLTPPSLPGPLGLHTHALWVPQVWPGSPDQLAALMIADGFIPYVAFAGTLVYEAFALGHLGSKKKAAHSLAAVAPAEFAPGLDSAEDSLHLCIVGAVPSPWLARPGRWPIGRLKRHARGGSFGGCRRHGRPRSKRQVRGEDSLKPRPSGAGLLARR